MHFVFLALFALQSATIAYVLQYDSQITVGVQIGSVIYAADFPHRALKPEDLKEGSQIQAEARDGKMTVQRKDGKTVSARIVWVQRTLIHPLPE